MRESTVEDYLKLRVKETGGHERKLRWIGRWGAPDRICWWHNGPIFVELKRPGKDARPEQAREHDRMRRGGCLVWVINTKEDVDAFVALYGDRENARCI